MIIKQEALSSYMLHNDCSTEEAKEHLKSIGRYFIKNKFSKRKIKHTEDNVILVTRGYEILYYRLKGSKYEINKF